FESSGVLDPGGWRDGMDGEGILTGLGGVDGEHRGWLHGPALRLDGAPRFARCLYVNVHLAVHQGALHRGGHDGGGLADLRRRDRPRRRDDRAPGVQLLVHVRIPEFAANTADAHGLFDRLTINPEA